MDASHGSNGSNTRVKKPSLHLPMSAIDSFLGHSRRHFSNQPHLETNPSCADAKKEKKMNAPFFDYDNGFGYDLHGDSIIPVGSCIYHNNQVGAGDSTLLGFDKGLGFDGVEEESLKSIEYERDTDEISGGVSRSDHPSNSANPKRKINSPANGNLVKGQWTLDEDRVLMELVMQHGERNWSQVAKQLSGRVGKQCRERWNNHLRPNVKKDRWSEEEERLLVNAHENLGNKWSEIAKHIPGRTENTIKNHWNAARRRQSTRRKNKTSHRAAAVSTILDDYIKAKNLHTSAALNPKSSPCHATSLSTTNSTAATQDSDTQEDTEITNSVHELSQFMLYEDEVMFMQSFMASLSYPSLQHF